VALGVVPIGSGNDFAKLVGVYRHSPVRAVRRLVTARTVRFDAGLVCGEYFVNSVGFGFGPEVVRVRNAMPGLSGFASYFGPLLLHVDGELREPEARQCTVRVEPRRLKVMVAQ